MAVVARARPFVGTVMAAGTDGAVAWWQAEPDRGDGGRVWLAPGDGSPARPTTVGAADLARAAGATPADGTGTVAGLAVSGRDVLALWRGKIDGRSGAAIVRAAGAADAAADEPALRVEIDPRTLLDALDLGPSLVLVDLALLRSGGELYVLARDLDRARLFRRPLDGYGLGTPLDLPDTPDAPDLRRGDLALAPGPGGGLLATATGGDGVTRVWSIGLDGTVRGAAELAGLPQGHAPAVAAGDDSPAVASASPPPLALFVADTSFATTPGRPTPLVPVGATLNLPALLRFPPGESGKPAQVAATGRDDFAAPADLAVYALNPAALLPAGSGVLIGFDPLTGLILRFDLKDDAAPPGE